MFESSERAHRRTPADIASMGTSAILDELTQTFEELNVAEEELRAQNEELHRAHEILLGERERYRALFEHAPVAYLVTNAEGTITDANRSGAALLGVRVDRLRGKPLSVFAQDVSRRRLRTALRLVRSDRDSVTVGINVTDRRQKLHRVEATISAARGIGGELVELRWLLVDQTRQAKRAELDRARAVELESLVAARTVEMESAQRLKDQLIATVSHEFRTALSAIGGYAELLEMGVRGPLSDPQLADVARIHHAYQHLAGVVDDLLNYSKLVSGKPSVDIEDVSLADVVRAATDMLVPLAMAKAITIEPAVVDPAVVIRADGERVRQILVNLVGNAIKFTAPGGRVRLCCLTDHSTVIVAISDNGPGIPSDKLEAIFEPFVRLATGGGRGTENGTGLGLAISRSLAVAMGGELWASSAPGEGSTFRLRLPRSTPLACSGATG